MCSQMTVFKYRDFSYFSFLILGLFSFNFVAFVLDGTLTISIAEGQPSLKTSYEIK